MRKLFTGVREYQDHLFESQRGLFEELAGGQSPLALFVTCSDSRICPNTLTQTGPGELFVLRNAGNIVPAFGAGTGGEAATVEYAVSALKVPDLVVCGHSRCGAMTALLDPSHTDELPAVRDWLGHAEGTRKIVEERYQDLPPNERLPAAIEANVLVQIENLRTHPSVSAAESRGELRLHGWVYEFETGRVRTYSPARQQFVSVAEAEDGPGTSTT